MTLITSSIPNLINGVSQQPATLRLASQAEAQLNFLSSVSEGLTSRPPSRHIAKLSASVWTDAFLHTINRDVNERYTVVIRNGGIQVFEAETGVERVVNAPEGTAYLAGAKADFRAVTVADYTFIVNRSVTCAMKPDLSPARLNEAMVFVRGANYGKTFTITLDGVEVAADLQPRGDDASHTELVDTKAIATRLSAQLTTNLPADFSHVKNDDLIVITRNNATPFSLSVDDGSGGIHLEAVYNTVQRFSDLPKNGTPNFTVEVVGDQSSSFDNYHVKFTTEGSTNSDSGVWKETLKGGEEFSINAATMPHILVREANGTFTFKKAAWEDRDVGDLNKIPHPSFVGKTLRDVFFFQNRLGIIADENVILSQDGEYFDFFRSTATTLLDTDPIDIAVTSDKVSLLNYAVPFNKSLLLFSDQSQFVFEGGDILTPRTASVAQATSFESLSGVRPVGVGQFVYFPVPRGSFTALREYFVETGNEQNDARDVTSHVPRYLPGGLFKMAASSAEDTLVGITTTAPNSLWVYRFFFNQEGKLQSAWSEWRLSSEDTLLSVEFIDGRMYLIVSRADGTYLDVLDLEPSSRDVGSRVSFRADRGVLSEDCTVVYDAGTDKTTITLPYDTAENLHVIVRGDDPSSAEGLSLPIAERPAGNTVVVLGDWSTAKLIIGQQYLCRYVFSTFYIRSQESGGGTSTNADGRMQIRYLSVDYSNAGYFRLVSQPQGRQRSEKVFSGRVLGTQSGTVGAFNLATGRFRIPVMTRNLTAYLAIETDSFLPASFTSAEWEATFVSRARKV